VKALYALLLVLYPARFRRRYRADLLAAFDEESADPRHAGVAGRMRMWRYLLRDLSASAARQRSRAAAAALRRATGRGEPCLPEPPRRRFMETLFQDVRYAFRQFVRRPAFAAVAVISLALAIGGNSLIFGLLDGFVFHPFPYPDADRFVAVGVTFPKVSSETSYIEVLSPPEYADIKASTPSFTQMAAFDLGNRNVSGGDVPERVFTALLLDDLFPVIGMRPAVGRGFSKEELAPNGPPAAIISHRLWQSRFGGDPGILSRSIRIGGQAASIVGVMPPGLVLIGTDLWIPWGGDPTRMARNLRQFTVIGRLGPGATLARANAELSTIAGRMQQSYVGQFKEYEGWRLTATPWAAALLQDVRPAAYILLGAVAFVLLIACANLANLMLARSTSRHRELAVRLALGAARWRIARQLLTESMLLALAGAVAGLFIAYSGLKFSSALIPAQFEMMDLKAGLNLRVLAWSALLAAATGLLVAILPALQATRTDPHESLKSDGRAGEARAGTRVRQTLIVAEIALSVMLLLGAGLLMRSFVNLQRTDLGFEPGGILTMRLTLPQQKYASGEAIVSFFEELTRRVESIPGVAASGMASQFPPLEPFTGQIAVEGVAIAGSMLPTANTTIASRNYFRTLQLPLLKGRGFGAEDTPDAAPRVIVNQSFVARYLGARDPLTSRVRIVRQGGPIRWADIVGVVADARNNGVGAPVRPEIFIPMEQGRDAWNQLFLVVRSSGDPSALVSSIRSTVAAIDPEQPVYAIQTMEEAVAVSSFQQRISAVLLGVFAALALVLAAVGIYGVMSYSVSARTQEIGVRMAVGAERTDVLRLVLMQVTRLAVIGLIVGVGLLLVAGKALSQLLYGVKPADPLTIAAVAVTLGAVALLAAWAPAWRASRVDPIVALRYE
jgi:putative ABC transport system permease protein